MIEWSHFKLFETRLETMSTLSLTASALEYLTPSGLTKKLSAGRISGERNFKTRMRRIGRRVGGLLPYG
jgi:hypothetical protein